MPCFAARLLICSRTYWSGLPIFSTSLSSSEGSSRVVVTLCSDLRLPSHVLHDLTDPRFIHGHNPTKIFPRHAGGCALENHQVLEHAQNSVQLSMNRVDSNKSTNC